MTRIAQVANFVAPHSGGIRTVLAELAAGYGAHGHEVVQVLPGVARRSETTAWGRRETVPGTIVPRTGYRVLRASAVRAVLDECGPDRLEVHDRSTLRSLGAWARDRGVPSTVVSHERLDRLLGQWLPAPVAGRAADLSNRRLAQGFDTVLCTTGWAAAEFRRLDIANLREVALGADLELFTPLAADPAMRARLAPGADILLVMASRLSPEKRPGIAIDAIRELVRRDFAVRLVIAGDGPLKARLRAAARDVPVTFLGHLPDRRDIARLLATADVVLAPGPVETFGLAAVEALASGTPVVVNASSALPGVVGTAGLAVPGTGTAFADGVRRVLQRPVERRRADARARAGQYRWERTVRGFLACHELVNREPVRA
jgi:alpha-1,6-mannosyltransferase